MFASDKQSFSSNKFQHLYISPLEKCNLKCKMCYTRKTGTVLTNQKILNFVSRYQEKIGLKTITFCGGEVFLLKSFPELVNDLTRQGIFIQIITNGTINRLKELKNPNSINLIVSLDGLESYHDKNRGEGMFRKSLTFLKKARKMGFQTEVFTIVTQENLGQLDAFEKLVKIPVTYHPRKPLSYLKSHPVSDITGKTKNFSFLTKNQIKRLGQKKKIFPPLNFGCSQISLMSNGLVYGCCEGINPLGKIGDTPIKLVEILKQRLDRSDCAEPNFKCGLNPDVANLGNSRC